MSDLSSVLTRLSRSQLVTLVENIYDDAKKDGLNSVTSNISRSSFFMAELNSQSNYLSSWNYIFQNALLKRDWSTLASIATEFQFIALTFAKILILERNLPIERKSYLPIDVGGVAGGDKFIVHGILFKFSTDRRGIYGGEEFAHKAAGHELRSMSAMMEAMECVENNRNQEESTSSEDAFRFPLMCVVDWRGYRVSACSLLPIHGDSTLVYGSSDCGKTINDGLETDEKVRGTMSAIASLMGLKGHFCTPFANNSNSGAKKKKFIWGPADFEIHKSHFDNGLYCLDFARLYPPCPNYLFSDHKSRDMSNCRGYHLFQLFRPEFCKRWKTFLSSDACSLFTSPEHRQVDTKEVAEAVYYLETVTIPNLAAYFDSAVSRLMPQSDAGAVKSVAAIGTLYAILSNIGESFHRAGINIRQLGRLRSHCTSPLSRGLLLVEMVSRCANKELKSLYRDKSAVLSQAKDETNKLVPGESCGLPGIIAFVRVAVQFMNCLFGECDYSSVYSLLTASLTTSKVWDSVKKRLCSKYLQCLNQRELEECESDGNRRSRFIRDKLLGSGQLLRLVFRRFIDLSGIEVKESLFKELCTAVEPYDLVTRDMQTVSRVLFQETDIINIEAKCKTPAVVSLANGIVLMERAKEISSGTVEENKQSATDYHASSAFEERPGLLRRAVEFFEESVSKNPTNAESLSRLGNALLQLAECSQDSSSRSDQKAMLLMALERAESSLELLPRRRINFTPQIDQSVCNQAIDEIDGSVTSSYGYNPYNYFNDHGSRSEMTGDEVSYDIMETAVDRQIDSVGALPVLMLTESSRSDVVTTSVNPLEDKTERGVVESSHRQLRKMPSLLLHDAHLAMEDELENEGSFKQLYDRYTMSLSPFLLEKARLLNQSTSDQEYQTPVEIFVGTARSLSVISKALLLVYDSSPMNLVSDSSKLQSSAMAVPDVIEPSPTSSFMIDICPIIRSDSVSSKDEISGTTTQSRTGGDESGSWDEKTTVEYLRDILGRRSFINETRSSLAVLWNLLDISMRLSVDAIEILGRVAQLPIEMIVRSNEVEIIWSCDGTAVANIERLIATTLRTVETSLIWNSPLSEACVELSLDFLLIFWEIFFRKSMMPDEQAYNVRYNRFQECFRLTDTMLTSLTKWSQESLKSRRFIEVRSQLVSRRRKEIISALSTFNICSPTSIQMLVFHSREAYGKLVWLSTKLVAFLLHTKCPESMYVEWEDKLQRLESAESALCAVTAGFDGFTRVTVLAVRDSSKENGLSWNSIMAIFLVCYPNQSGQARLENSSSKSNIPESSSPNITVKKNVLKRFFNRIGSNLQDSNKSAQPTSSHSDSVESPLFQSMQNADDASNKLKRQEKDIVVEFPTELPLEPATEDSTFIHFLPSIGLPVMTNTNPGVRSFCICVDYKKKLIFVGGQDKSIRIFSMELQCRLKVLVVQSSVESIDCDGDVMVSGTAEGTVHVWSTQKEDFGVLKMVLRGHVQAVRAVAVSWKAESAQHSLSSTLPRCVIVSGSSDRSIRVWNGETGDVMRIFRGNWPGFGVINSVQFVKEPGLQSNRALVVSTSSDMRVRLWNIETGHHIRQLRYQPVSSSDMPNASCVFNKIGIIIIGYESGVVRLFEMTTGECVETIKVFSETCPISSVDVIDISSEPVQADSTKKTAGLLLAMGRSGKGKVMKLVWMC